MSELNDFVDGVLARQLEAVDASPPHTERAIPGPSRTTVLHPSPVVSWWTRWSRSKRGCGLVAAGGGGARGTLAASA